MSKRESEEHELQPAAELQKPDLDLNPDFDFWENRGAHAQAPEKVAAQLNEQQEHEDRSVVQTLTPESLTPPDSTHTLLNRGRWVRPWGLRNFAYSLVAFIGLQVLVTVIIAFIAVGQTTASGGDPAQIATDSAGLTAKVSALLMVPVVLALVQFSMYGMWLAYMWWSTNFRGAKSWAKDFGLWFKKRDILIALAATGGLYALEQGVTSLLQALYPKANYSGMDNGAIFSGQSGISFFLVGIGIAGIIGPICEELYFRGYFLTGIQRWFAHYVPRLRGGVVSTIAIIVSSAVFGLFHFQGTDTFGQILVVFFTGGIGAVLAIFRVVFKRLGPGILTHICYNTTGLLLAYFAVGGN
jgi:membrane protease YdiL (CAAX protease family)